MSEDLKILIAILIKNIIVIALFILLAIKFNHWWIVLFSIIFLTFCTGKSENKEKEVI